MGECSNMLSTNGERFHYSITKITPQDNGCSCMTSTKDSILKYVKYCRLTPCNTNGIVTSENCSDTTCTSCTPIARQEMKQPLDSLHLLGIPRCHLTTWTDQAAGQGGCPMYMKETVDFLTLGCEPSDKPVSVDDEGIKTPDTSTLKKD